MLSQERGARAEFVVKNYFISKGYQLQDSHRKIFGVEVDLIFHRISISKIYSQNYLQQQLQNRNNFSNKRKSETLFVEVKKLSRYAELENRWNYKQKNRFLKMASSYCEAHNKMVRCLLAVVTEDEEVFLYEGELEVEI